MHLQEIIFHQSISEWDLSCPLFLFLSDSFPTVWVSSVFLWLDSAGALLLSDQVRISCLSYIKNPPCLVIGGTVDVVKDCSNPCLTKSCLFISWISLPLCFRDVLDVCLHIPRWIYSVTDTKKERLSQLEPSASGPSWAFAFHNLQQNNTKLCWGALSANFTDISVAETWLSTPPDQQTDQMSQREPSSMMCSIQVCCLSTCV